MMIFMKRVTLEPGLVQILRVYVIASAILIPLSWRAFDSMIRFEGNPDWFQGPALPVLLFLVIYVIFPGWQRRMGHAFLPVALILLVAQAFLGNYLTMQWFVPPNSREVAMLAFMTRVWITFQFVVLFVAWQYDLFWVLLSGIALCLLDASLAFPYVNVRGELYPFYTAIVVGRLVSVTAAGLGLAWLMKRQREQRAALAEANQKLAEANRKLAQYAATTEQLAVSQERNRLARELHDTLAHSLSGATVQLEAVQALWEVEPSKARQLLDQAVEVTQNGLTEARRALQSLRASPLEDLGLALAVSDMAKSAAARASLRLELDMQNHLKNLTPDMEQCIYRVAQESLTNVTRHADATTLHVSLRHDSDSVALTIADDGRGFDMAAVENSRYGLKGLRERAEMVGATLQVESSLQGGTTVRLVVPTTKEAKA